MKTPDKANREKIARLRKVVDVFKDREFLQNIALSFQTFVRERTIMKNKDIHGVPFREYSEEYAKVRERNNLGLDVDLIFSRLEGTDAMMESIDDLVFKDLSGVAMFMDNERAEELAIYHNIKGAGKSKVIRQFWGLTDEDKEAIVEMIGEHSLDYLKTEIQA